MTRRRAGLVAVEVRGGPAPWLTWTGWSRSFVRSPDDPELMASVVAAERRYLSVDSTLGYRVDPELTVRVAHAAIRRFGKMRIDHQLGASVIWTRRWW